MQRYKVSGWNGRYYETICFVDAESQEHAIRTAHQIGGLKRFQIRTAKAEIDGEF